MRIPVLAIWVVVLLLSAGRGAGQEPGSASASGPSYDREAAIRHGELLFQIHCANCHGLEGRGDGPLAGDLGLAPAKLTRLAEPDEDGKTVFPFARIESVIDGRDDVGGHGTPEMPVWGLTFQESGRDADQEEAVRGKIKDLLEFLRIMQEVDVGEPADLEEAG